MRCHAHTILVFWLQRGCAHGRACFGAHIGAHVSGRWGRGRGEFGRWRGRWALGVGVGRGRWA